jgi:DnaJ like chaperone protein
MLGGVAGFAMGGPLGAMVGAALGHAADAGALGGKGGAISAATPDLMAFFGSKENLFSFSVVVLSAKLAKVDGPIKREVVHPTNLASGLT